MDRYTEKLALEKELVDKINSRPRLFSPEAIERRQANNDVKQLRYSRWQVKGQFINHKQLLLDNQILEGRIGYRVITPLLMKGDPKLILVDRGWIPIVKDRTFLPTFAAIPELVTIKGMINMPSAGLQLKEIKPMNDVWPLRVQTVDFKALSKILGTELYPFILQLEPGSKEGFHIPSPTQNFSFPPTRHLGYAIQWFTLALASLIYYTVINSQWLRDEELPFKNQTE